MCYKKCPPSGLARDGKPCEVLCIERSTIRELPLESAENIASEFLRKKGIEPNRFTKEELRSGKTPDFRVCSSGNLLFYTEVKEIAHDSWLDDLFEDAPPGALVGGVRNDSSFNLISSKIHEAVGQFDAVNSERACPNVLVFVNRHKRLNVTHLDNVLSGNFVDTRGGRHPIYRKFSEGRISDEKSRVTLYVWLDDDAEFYSVNERRPEEIKLLASFFGFKTS
jgi:hypothetical protein